MATDAPMVVAGSILIALCVMFIVAAIVSIFWSARNSAYDDNGAPLPVPRGVNNYGAEQLRYMASVRWRNKKRIWEELCEDNLRQGLPSPPHYPGDSWDNDDVQEQERLRHPTYNFPGAGSDIQPDYQTQRSTQASTAAGFVPPTYGPSTARSSGTYHDTSYLDEFLPEGEADEMLTPLVRNSTVSDFSRDRSGVLRNWQQAGPYGRVEQEGMRLSTVNRDVPRITVNDNELDIAEAHSASVQVVAPMPYAGPHANPNRGNGPYTRMPFRSSSVYSGDTLTQVSAQPQPQPAYVRSTVESDSSDDEDLSQPPTMGSSQVHQMIARFERFSPDSESFPAEERD